MLRAIVERSQNRFITQCNVQQPWLRARTGRSPKRNTAQGNALGTRTSTIWRAVSATGPSEILARSFLLLFQSAITCFNVPQGAALGYIHIGLSARLCCVQTILFKVKQQNFKQKEVTKRNISYCSNGRTRKDTDVSWNLAKALFFIKNNCLAKFVIHSQNACVHCLAELICVIC